MVFKALTRLNERTHQLIKAATRRLNFPRSEVKELLTFTSGSRASCRRGLSLTSAAAAPVINPSVGPELIRSGRRRSERSLLAASPRETKSTGDKTQQATQRPRCVHGSTQSSGITYTHYSVKTFTLPDFSLSLS